jgi:hypothetical protein
VDFTREPVIETVITPKEGCKLVIRNSKGSGQEEYFVDAVEVITFGQAIFFRSLERPKPFIVPASDYEVLEVREARIVLKNVGIDRSIKIGGGRDGNMRPPKDAYEDKSEPQEAAQAPITPDTNANPRPDARNDRKRDRRRQSKRRREVVGQSGDNEESSDAEKVAPSERVELAPPSFNETGEPANQANGALLAALLAPPPLISETIGRYKEKFKDAFYTKEEQESKLTLDPAHIPLASEPLLEPDVALPSIAIEQPAFGAFELSEEAEEEIYRQRKRKFLHDERPEEASLASEGVMDVDLTGSEEDFNGDKP